MIEIKLNSAFTKTIEREIMKRISANSVLSHLK